MKKTWALWEMILMLSLIIVILSFYAFQENAFQYDDFTLKKSKMGVHFTQTPPHQAQINKITDSLKAFQSENPFRIDSSSQVILLTGDSMCEGLMFAFKRYAKFNGHELKVKVWYSSTTELWSKTDSLKKLIDYYQPSYIFFTTGSNELFVRDIEERDKYVKNIVGQVGKKHFIWIGPPNWKEDTGINEVIAKNVGDDRFFVSKYLTFTRASDGAHPTWTSARFWADTIASWVMFESRKRILLEKPPEDFDLANKK